MQDPSESTEDSQQPSTFGQRFGQLIRHHREQESLSQRALAERLRGYGIALDPSAITRIEQGSRTLSLEESWAIARTLGLTVDDLLLESDHGALAQKLSTDRLETCLIALWTAIERYRRAHEALSFAVDEAAHAGIEPGTSDRYAISWLLNRAEDMLERFDPAPIGELSDLLGAIQNLREDRVEHGFSGEGFLT